MSCTWSPFREVVSAMMKSRSDREKMGTMPGARRQPAERAIIYGGVLGGMEREDVNDLLASVGGRDLAVSSYRSIKNHYVPYFGKDLRRLGAAIQHPPTWSDLKEAGERDLPAYASADDEPTTA
jgi:hypothetical protein